MIRKDNQKYGKQLAKNAIQIDAVAYYGRLMPLLSIQIFSINNNALVRVRQLMK